MRYLIDTNVISELYKKRPHDKVLDWFANIHTENLFVSCLTIGELRSGAIKKSKKDSRAASHIFNWIDEILDVYRDNLLGIDIDTAEIWADFISIDSNNAVDALLAAQAYENNMSLVTRNTKHFMNYAIKLINPFD